MRFSGSILVGGLACATLPALVDQWVLPAAPPRRTREEIAARRWGALEDTSVPKPFTVATTDEALEDLQQRLLKWRPWDRDVPMAHADGSWSYGMDAGYMRELVRYWAHEYEAGAARHTSHCASAVGNHVVITTCSASTVSPVSDLRPPKSTSRPSTSVSEAPESTRVPIVNRSGARVPIVNQNNMLNTLTVLTD